MRLVSFFKNGLLLFQHLVTLTTSYKIGNKWSGIIKCYQEIELNYTVFVVALKKLIFHYKTVELNVDFLPFETILPTVCANHLLSK